MRNQTNRPTRASVSELAVRAAFGRRQQRADQDQTDAPSTGARRLRRWSVAELIAAAAVRPPAEPLSH